MRFSRKATLWLAGILSCLLGLLILLALFLPRFLDLELIKDKISNGIYERTSVRVELGSIEIKLLPRPCAVIRKGSFSFPGKLSGTVESLTMFPRVLPLLWGNIAVAELHIDSPELGVAFQETGDGASRLTSGFTAPQLESLLPALPALVSAAAAEREFLIHIEHGSIAVRGTEECPLRFTDIQTRVRVQPGQFDVSFTCASDLWESALFKLSIESPGEVARGEVSLAGFKPQVLAGYGLHPSLQFLGSSEINADLSFNIDESRRIDAWFKGSAPLLTLKRDTELVELKADGFEGTVVKEGSTVTVSLARMNLAEPRIDVTGEFAVDSAAPSVRTQLRGQDADATAIRKTALALWGDRETTRKIFNIVRGGHVPEISFEAEGASLADLGKSENFVLTGSMENGIIFIPNVLLEVEGARGSVIIAGGILDGKDLEGVTSGSRGRDGILKLDLKRDENDDGLFHLDIEIDADLAQLPAVLKRVVKNEPFLREMAMIKDPVGRARGRLVLGERLKSVQTKVDAEQFNLEGRYERVPHRIELTGGAFLFENTMVAARSLDGRVGKSSFSDVDISIDWGENGPISVSTPAAVRVHADEIFPWLMTFGPIRQGLQEFQDIKGSLAMAELNLRGPFLSPRKWTFLTKGSVENLVMRTRFFPSAVTISRGDFEADQDRLGLKACRASLMDGSLVVSGGFKGYLGGRLIRDLTIEGSVGEAVNDWISNLVSLPPVLRARSPMGIQRSRLVWEEDGGISFSGDMRAKDGPRLSMDLRKTAEGLSIDRLAVSDKDSNAALSLKLKDHQLELSFSGNLNGSSLDKLLARNELLGGSVQGSLTGVIYRDQVGKSKADGKLHVSGVAYRYGLDEPVTIENADLSAGGGTLKVDSGLLKWRGNSLNVQGTVDIVSNAFRLDLDVTSSKLLLEKSTGGKDAGGKPPRSKEPLKYLGVPLNGEVRLRADALTYGDLTWKPLFANASLRPGGLSIDVIEANLCSIPTLGRIEATPEMVRMNLKLAANNQDLDSTLACLWNKKDLITGKFRLTGDMKAEGTEDQLSGKMEGSNLKLHAEGGRIYRMGLLTKIFAVLNFTEVYRGEVPDLVNEGFAYETIQAEGTVANGKLKVEYALLNAPSMRMAGQGEIDLARKTVDMTIIVAPLRTVDKIVNSVPLLGRMLGGTLISISLKATGDLEDPKVSPLPPSALGSEFLGFVKRTFQLPVQLIEPMWK